MRSGPWRSSGDWWKEESWEQKISAPSAPASGATWIRCGLLLGFVRGIVAARRGAFRGLYCKASPFRLGRLRRRSRLGGGRGRRLLRGRGPRRRLDRRRYAGAVLDLTRGLVALALAAGAVGVLHVLRRRRFALAGWVALMLAAWLAVAVSATTWVSAKEEMLTSPVLVLMGFAGIAALLGIDQLATFDKRPSFPTPYGYRSRNSG